MSTKVEYYSQKTQKITKEITQTPEQWMGFLNASSRLYKYPFTEQLQIYSQRPNATAVADYDIWNKKMNRYVKRGAAGIALVNESGDGRTLRYVFDIAETGVRQNSRPVYLWQMTDEHIPTVQQSLEAAFAVKGLPLADELTVLSLSLAAEYWQEHKQEFFDIVANSALVRYNNDSSELMNAFISTAANSAAYALMSRSPVDENAYFSSDDFKGAAEFNTVSAVQFLGTAVSEISSQVFREMERAVRTYDRAKLMAERNENHGKDDIHAGRGLFYPEYSAASDERPRPADEVRVYAPEVAEREPSDTLQHNDAERHDVSAPVGYAGGSGRKVRAVDERPREAESAPGQSERPDGLGAAHEYAGSTGGRDGDSGVYHGGTAESDQLSFFGTAAQIAPEAEQIKTVENNPDIEKPLAESNKPSAFAISEEEIDSVLRYGSGFSGGKLRIYALYQQQGDAKERIAFLKKEYDIGGHSCTFADGSHGYVDYNGKGLFVRSYAHGQEKRLTWTEVDKRLDALCADSLLVSGKYLSDEERERYAALVEKYDGDVPMPVAMFGFPEKAEVVPEQSAPMTEGSAAEGKVSLEAFEAEYYSAYDKLYSSEAETGELSNRFDVQYENDAEFRELVNAFVAKRQDAVSSDGEAAAAVIAFDNLKERNKTLENASPSKVEPEAVEGTDTVGVEAVGESETASEPQKIMVESAIAPEGVQRREMTDLEKKAAEIAEPYYDMSLQEKINLIAPTFGARSGRIDRSLCRGKWRGTSDVSIVFDNGVSLFLGNDRTPNTKKLPVQNEMVNSAVVQYNPQIVALTKETALKALREREARDNAIAAEKGLKPYKVLTVELVDGTQSVREGWYYVTIAVDGKIHAHLETGLNFDIKDGREDKLSNNRDNYFVAGALKNEDVDFVFNNVGFSTSRDLYTTPLTDEVRVRAEKVLSEREAEEQTAAVPQPIAPSPFVQQHMQDAEALSSQEAQEQAQTSEIQEIGQDAPNHEIVARFQSLLPRRDGTETLNQIVITSDADGYHNHFFYDDKTGKGALSTNGHATVKDAIADVYKRFPTATGYYRYYSTHRPFMPGSYPKMNGFERFTNFDEGKIFCDEIGREAWGYVEYPAPLSVEKQKNYELLRTLDRAAPEIVVSDNVAVGRGLPEFLREVPEEAREATVEQFGADVTVQPEAAAEHPVDLESPAADENAAEDHDGMLDRTESAEIPAAMVEVLSAEPTVTVIWSEDSGIQDGAVMPLHKADKLFRELDFQMVNQEGYNKTKFRIDYTWHGEESSYVGRQDFGDGDGGLIDHIQGFFSYYENNPEWDNRVLRESGEQGLAEFKEDTRVALHEYVPYLRLHVTLTEIEQTVNDFVAKYEDIESAPAAERAYYSALSKYVFDSRKALNSGRYALPTMPKLEDFKLEAEKTTEAEPLNIAVSESSQLSGSKQLEKAHEFDYMLLSRLQSDCDYFLGNGNRNEKHLWAGNVAGQIAKMRELYDGLNSLGIAPEWITGKDIDRFEAVMSTDDSRVSAAPVAGTEQEEITPSVRESAAEEIDELKAKVEPHNFRITDDHLGEGGAKTKFRANMDAIYTLQRLEAEGRNATPEEQKVLSGYVGWGGLPDAFDDSKPAWAHEYRELKAALTDEEYAAARGSVLNAHYTSPTVIKAIYEAIGNMGFEHGNILEPSMGVGNFFGLLPESMADSRLYGVELDSITGRIAQKLYPKAEITVAGFETTDRRDFFDVAVGNVPFGNYKVNDKAYNKLGFSIHNYFFAKTLDQVRPGGVVAFVTSRYTMDSKDSTARRYIAQRAELLGAIRLPNNAFRANAGTDVVSDILFLQKRDRAIEIDPDWVYLGQTPDGISMNSYFLEHPEMVLGEIGAESTQYGRDELTVNPIPGADLAEQLHAAVQNVGGRYELPALPEQEDLVPENDCIAADPNVKNFSYAMIDGKIYFREDSVMRQCKLSDKAAERVKGLINLRQIMNELMDYQLQDYSDEAIAVKQQELGAAYDRFTKDFGIINSRANARAFEKDSSFYLLCSLENIDENGKMLSKADMFSRRTIRPERVISGVDTPADALAVSIGEHGKVDLPYMAELLGTPGQYNTITSELSGVIFRDPEEADPDDVTKGWHAADDYLSGNVREKLRIAQLAARSDRSYAVNVSALEKVQPKDLSASEIGVKLGATWIDADVVKQFLDETINPPTWAKRYIDVRYSTITGSWHVTNQKYTSQWNDVSAYSVYGTKRISAYKILEETLNQRDVQVKDKVTDENGKEKYVINQRETVAAQQKQQAIRDAFQDWIWADPGRRRSLVQKYNERFNSVRPREYDGKHIHFGGMNPEIQLMEHQTNAIAHVLYGGNTLLAHEVGAGKTFEMAAAAMEGKRLGLCHKSLFVVPNHLTLQWANEFLRLYPGAKLLVASKKDFETANRKKFCARIATGDYDAIIIGHSQFEKIPISLARQTNLLERQIDEITESIDALKYDRTGDRLTIKELEKMRKSLKAKLSVLMADDRKDDVITFEQLGVDRLFVDEAHNYKNLFLYTKMRNVAGLSTTEAQKSQDMFLKCQYMDEITGGKGVVFATGTPVSNSMTELYTMMRYLQYGTLQEHDLTFFDNWAANFGETTTAIELAPEGTGYRARTRFAKFYNLPELMCMFKSVADIKTADQLKLPVPEAKRETIVVKPSEIQKKMVEALSERAEKIHNGNVDPSVDNMLKITSDGRKIGLDQRLMNPLLPDDPNSKLNACVRNVLKIWEEGKDERLTQLLFCDLSTPKGDGTFNVYEDIRDKLITAGVPKEEIAFVHDADSDAKKRDLFAKVRSGEVRVLLGSTQKMGVGTNVQDRLIAVHHLDVGYRPADMEQRNGRIIRQGNHNPEVQIYQYVTEGTFDAYLYQMLENKQRFISQIMTSKSPVRSCEDVDEQVLSYAEVKALCAGSPKIKEKMDLDIEVSRLKVLKSNHMSQQYRLQDSLATYYPVEIEKAKYLIDGFSKDAETAAAHPQVKDGFCGMSVDGKYYAKKEDAGNAIIQACAAHKSVEPVKIGEYRGFSVEVSFDCIHKAYQLTMKDNITHWITLSDSATGNITRMDNVLASIPERKEKSQQNLQNLYKQQEVARVELGKPFPQEAELAEKSARLAALDAELNMDDSRQNVDRENDDVDNRPSALANLRGKLQAIAENPRTGGNTGRDDPAL